MTCEEYIEHLADAVIYLTPSGKHSRGMLHSHALHCESCMKIGMAVRSIFTKVLKAPRFVKSENDLRQVQRHINPYLVEGGLIYGERFLANTIEQALDAKTLPDMIKQLSGALQKHIKERNRFSRREDKKMPEYVTQAKAGRALDAKIAELCGGKVMWDKIPDTDESQLFVCWTKEEDYEICPHYSNSKRDASVVYLPIAKREGYWLGYDNYKWQVLDRAWNCIVSASGPALVMCRAVIFFFKENEDESTKSR